MSDWVCVASNPVSGVSTWIKPDPDTPDGVLIQERQDVSALLDANKAQKNVASSNWKGDGLHSVARIPLAMLHAKDSYIGDAIREQDDKAVSRFLNDSDNEYLRTKGGNI
jgi:hypothetical protein